MTLASVSLDFFLELPCSSFRSRCRVTDFFAGFPLGSENFFSELVLAIGAAIAGLVRPRLVEWVKLEE